MFLHYGESLFNSCQRLLSHSPGQAGLIPRLLPDIGVILLQRFQFSFPEVFFRISGNPFGAGHSNRHGRNVRTLCFMAALRMYESS